MAKSKVIENTIIALDDLMVELQKDIDTRKGEPVEYENETQRLADEESMRIIRSLRELLPKNKIESMTLEELQAHDKAACERFSKHKAALPSDLVPRPTVKQQYKIDAKLHGEWELKTKNTKPERANSVATATKDYITVNGVPVSEIIHKTDKK